jgi:ribonuclease HI
MGSRIERIYTDGACSGNPGPGGWGVLILREDGQRLELGDRDRQTTNNRMEMQAAIAGLTHLRREQGQDAGPVTLYTDSQYVIKGITEWVRGWKRKGWMTAAGKPVLNRDLWEELDRLNGPGIRWQYVRGHAGDPGNERCDAIARGFATGRPPTLAQPIAPSTSTPKPTPKSTPKPAPKPAPTPPPPSPSVPPVPAPISVDNHHHRNGTQLTLMGETDKNQGEALESIGAPESLKPMADNLSVSPNPELLDGLPRELRVAQLKHLIDTLHIADEVAAQGYLITSAELADLMDVNASAVTSRGDNWVWRNWIVTRARREGNQILWQLERVEI